MNETARPDQQRARTRVWPPLLAIFALATIIALMVVVPVVSLQRSRDARNELTDDLDPFRASLSSYNLAVVRLAAEARAYAATRSPRALGAFEAASDGVTSERTSFLALAPDARFEEEAAAFTAAVDRYGDISSAIVAAESAGNDFESFRLIEQEGEPQLVSIQSEADKLGSAADARADELRDDIRTADNQALALLAITGLLGLIAAAALAYLVIRNIRLGRRIEEQRRRLDNVISDVPGIVWEAWGRPDATSQRVDYVSPYIEKMLGYSVDEWLSTPNFWLTIVHPDDKEHAAASAAMVFETGVSTPFRFRWLAKDGRSVWSEAYSTPIRDADGNAVGMRGVTLDISEQMLAASALERERARFKSIVAATDFGVYQTDEVGHLEYMNPAAEAMLGYQGADLLGQEVHPVFHRLSLAGQPIPLEECRLYRSTRDGTTYQGEEAFSTKDGRVIPVEVVCSIIEVGGRSTGAVVVFQDITTRLRRERMRDDFVAFASHELRNPLTSLKGFSKWLSDRAADHPERYDAESREAIDTLVDEALRMESIIELFLDLARVETDRLTFEIEPVNLRHILNDECTRLRQRFPAALCATNLDPAVAVAHSDEHRLRQVLSNLLENAAKYGGDTPEISVTATQEDGAVAIRIKDNGPGIPLEDQPFVFERYYRGRAEGSGRRGLGVGLFVCKQIVDKLAGSLEFTSSPGEGTEFVLRLPIVTE